MSTEDILKFPQKPKVPPKLMDKFNYFSTSKGMVFSGRFMVALSCGAGIAFYSLQTLMLEKYLNFIRAYR